MQFHFFKLRFRRRFRRSQKQVEGISQQAEAGFEKNFLKRLGHLGQVWRFVAGWVGLLVLISACLVVQIEGLSNHYQTTQPVSGGAYTEGIVGSFTNANPLYATGDVDAAVSKLLFASLFTYDQQNHLVGDLADRWTANNIGTVYTVHLKPNLTWQDGKPLTADDVVFTYKAIQNPDAQSPLAASWQGITVTKKDAQTIVFNLPNPLSSFPYNLINGIIPAHAFAGVDVSDWRSAAFNTTKPVGAGPFQWGVLQVQGTGDSSETLIALKPFDQYQGGRPKLDSFVVHAFSDTRDMVGSFQKHQINAISLASPPADVLADSDVQQYSFLISGATMAFFNTAAGASADVSVRQALVQGTDTAAIISKLGYATKAVKEPLLDGQLGYDPAYTQAAYNPVAARATLDQAGWKLGANGIRTKDGKPLTLSLYATDSHEDARVSDSLASYWRALGVQVSVRHQNASDFQTALNNATYNVVLNSIAIGVDPDVFVYWDSSQTDPRSSRLNFSQYKSTIADAALEAGRTRLDPALRVIKYRPFLQAWQQDAPALGLYQPRYLYLSNEKVYGLDSRTINTGTDHYDNVQNWMIRTAKVSN